MTRAQDTPDVGQRIRAMREEQGYSLRVLAERSGLSLNAISLIERGQNSPTVSSLHLLASALDVSITDFFTEERDQPVVFVPPPARLRSEADGLVMESLGIGLRNQQLEPFLLRAAPGTGTLEQPISHSGEEFVYCLEGEVEYCVGDEIYELQPGFSLLFEATIPHCFRNVTTEPALLMMVFHAGEGGHLARRLHLDFSTMEARASSAGHPHDGGDHEDVGRINS
ncbi:MAG TPA: XRE family transcriptional regulator [Candidatus Sulfomarinibacteraceae bacterium]|nr:XRE family transcriptional regulator [Candidatus Sulfomarinibacteraceae bacterium]